MGGLFSKFSRKRKHTPDNSDTESPKPKRIKLSSETSVHAASIAYESLFLQGRDSDINVVILNKTWKLHKSFLIQSPYFLKYLKNNPDITQFGVSISDNNITHSSLELCFGFLYGKSLDFITDANIDSVVATAIFLQLTVIVDKAVEHLINNADVNNAVKYFYLADKYDLTDVCNYVYHRLLLSLIPVFKSMSNKSAKLYSFLCEFKIDLLERLLKDPEILIERDEFDLYQLMKKWVTAVSIQNHPESVPESQVFATENGLPFLESNRGIKFVSLFEILNLPVLFTKSRYYDILLNDKIIPTSWLDRALDQSWKTHITFFDSTQKEITYPSAVTPEELGEIIKNENTFLEQPNRIFKRFSILLNKTSKTFFFNGFVFYLQILPNNTLYLKINLKPDIPHILIPTYLFLKLATFYTSSLWKSNEKKNKKANKSSTDDTSRGPSTSNARDVQEVDNEENYNIDIDGNGDNDNIDIDGIMNNADDNAYIVNSDVDELGPISLNMRINSQWYKQWVDQIFSNSSLYNISQFLLFRVMPFVITGCCMGLPNGYYEKIIGNFEDEGDPLDLLTVVIHTKFIPYFELKQYLK